MTTLRMVSLMAVVAGALGSEGLMLRAGQHSPRLLIVAFTVWVLSPFAALLWAYKVSSGWSIVTRTALYGVALVVALSALAIYGDLITVKPQAASAAFVFVAVPPASWAFMAIVIPMAALLSGKRSR